jgi:hypothetical protein
MRDRRCKMQVVTLTELHEGVALHRGCGMAKKSACGVGRVYYLVRRLGRPYIFLKMLER